MPYIAQERRVILQLILEHFFIDTPGMSILRPDIRNVGELNYVITRVILGYLKSHAPHPQAACAFNYAGLNEIVGVLECVKQEFLRRVVAPYENGKIAENGDVYPQP